jgi:transcriptional regulator with XRE-family HTH domain
LIRTSRPRPSHLAAEHCHRTGRRLAALRTEAGISQVALGKAIGRPQSAIAKLETGVTRLLFAEAIEISDILGVDLRLLDPLTALAPGPRDAAPRRLGHLGRQMRLPFE